MRDRRIVVCEGDKATLGVELRFVNATHRPLTGQLKPAANAAPARYSQCRAGQRSGHFEDDGTLAVVIDEF